MIERGLRKVNKKSVIVIASVIILAVLGFALGKSMKSCPLSNIKKVKFGSCSGLLAQARGMEARGELLQAKSVYQKLAGDFSNSSDMANWQKKIEDLNIRLLFSPTITPNSIIYEVKPGDTLNKIAKQFNTTVELIKKSSNLNSDIIAPGRKLKVWTEPFSILVDKSQNTLILKTKDEEIVKTYTVATGVNNSTPVGTFKIVEKIPNPPWFKSGAAKPIPPGSPDNILGTRWLGLSIPSYGIHGTTDPQSLGKQVTQGCVRMANLEVEELYIIVPKGTEVNIVD